MSAPYIRRKAHEKFASIGRPMASAPLILEIERAALRAGLTPDQAHCLTVMAYQGHHENTEDFDSAARGFVAATRKRHAARHPDGKWAAVRAAGHNLDYVTEDVAREVWDAYCRMLHEERLAAARVLA